MFVTAFQRACANAYPILLLLLFSIVANPVAAQVDTGKIVGTVLDASGSSIPEAKISILNQGTGLRQATQTSADGSYVLAPVKAGQYTVEVAATGFQSARRADVAVSVQQQAVLNFQLRPGEITTTIDVTDTLPVLQTQSGSVGETVEARTINNLPLSGRNFVFLARLTAGVTHGQPEGRGLNASGWFAANGTRPAQNNYLLDGIDNNSNNVDFLSGAAYVLKPPPDAINEFKLQTSAFGAEFGRAGGAVLNATLKSGTNAIHGSAWEFLRNDNLDAADFFQNANRTRKGEFKQNQFGVAIGGPIKRNKAFFFADYEGTRVRQMGSTSGSVPTAAWRNSGYTNFQDLISGQSGTRTDALGRVFPLGTVFDPSTQRQVGPGPRDWVREPFVNNIIPASRMNPNAVKLLNLYPEANLPGLVGNYAANLAARTNVNSMDARVDYNWSEKDQTFGRYSLGQRASVRPGPFPGLGDGGGFNDGTEQVRTQGAALSHTHTFSSTTINETRLGFNRERVYRVQANGDDLTDIPGKFGIQGIPQLKGNGGLPALNIGGLSRLGAADWLVSERFSNTVQLTNNLTKIYGKHAIKIGGEMQKIDFPWMAPPTARGSFTWAGNYTSVPEVGDGSTGRAQFVLNPVRAATKSGDELIGMVNSVGASNYGGVSNVKSYRGLYIQDDWKATRRLTLNIGLRWDYFSQIGEKHGAQGNYDPDTRNFYVPARRKGDPEISSSVLNAFAADRINLLYTDQYGTGLGISQKGNFAPRFGFAYQAAKRTVVRGGYGMYYGAFENRGGAPNLGYNYPFQFSFAFATADGDSLSPVKFFNGTVSTLETGLSAVPLDPRLVQVSRRGAVLNLRAIQFNYKTPYVQSMNFALQQDLGGNQSLEAAYVGSLSRNLETFIGHNQPNRMAPAGTNTWDFVDLQYFSRGSSYASTVGNAHYHSLQTKYTKRYSRGLDFLLAYTWAKALTNAGDLLSGGNVSGARAVALPGFGLKKEMGLAGFDVRHALVWSGTYEMPFWQGQAVWRQLEHGHQRAFRWVEFQLDHHALRGPAAVFGLFAGTVYLWVLSVGEWRPEPGSLYEPTRVHGGL